MAFTVARSDRVCQNLSASSFLCHLLLIGFASGRIESPISITTDQPAIGMVVLVGG
jgi:hypothetical protein